jgi:hypothetical protein
MSTLFAAVAASHPYLIMAMRMASARGKPLRLVRYGSLVALVWFFLALNRWLLISSHYLQRLATYNP